MSRRDVIRFIVSAVAVVSMFATFGFCGYAEKNPVGFIGMFASIGVLWCCVIVTNWLDDGE